MSLQLKRTLSTSEGHISPPPSTKRRIEQCEPSESERPLPSEKHLRIFSWNVNGVGPFLQRPISFFKTTAVQSSLRAFLARHDWPHILCLQEVKINARDAATQRALQHAANLDSRGSHPKLSPNPTYSIHFSLPRDKFNATGFGGKVHEWDLEGRVLITTISIPSTLPRCPNPYKTSETPTPGNIPTSLSILHAYWPNGTTNPYHSPLTGSPQGTRHTHKLNFHAHMLREALTLQSLSHHVLLIGDMNIAPQRIDGHPNLRTWPDQHVTNRNDFNAKFLDGTQHGAKGKDGFKGVDIWRFLHGDERKYTYFPRGRKWGESCDRVDLVVAGRSLVGEGEASARAIVGMQIYDTPLERGHSDHVPLSVVVDLEKL